MNSGDCKYIWQASDWPTWRYDLAALVGPMTEVSHAQGLLMGRLADVDSMSAQIQRERKAYYDMLERTQKRSMDVTEWLAWFLDTLHRGIVGILHCLHPQKHPAR